MNRELAFMLGFSLHAKHGPERTTIVQNNDSNQVLSSSTRPSSGGIFYYFVYLDIIEYQTIGIYDSTFATNCACHESR